MCRRGDLKGNPLPPGGSLLVPSYGCRPRDQHFRRTHRRHSAAPPRPQSRTPALHRFSGHVSVESPGRPRPRRLCPPFRNRASATSRSPEDEPAVRCWDKLGPFGVIAPLELDPVQRSRSSCCVAPSTSLIGTSRRSRPCRRFTTRWVIARLTGSTTARSSSPASAV